MTDPDRPSDDASFDGLTDKEREIAIAHRERKAAARDWADEKGKMYREYMTTSVIGLEVGVSIAVASVIGWWADRKFGTAPWGMLAGLTIGLTHAGKLLWNMAKKHMVDDEEGADPGEAPSPPDADVR